jgi:hypothetical protein
MKKLFLLLTILIASRCAFAQKELITLDEHNKYIYYQIVDMPGVVADTLYQRCLVGLKSHADFKPSTEAGPAITVKSKTMIYSSQTYVKHEEGELTYTLHIEFKDLKYRYWLTDFVFTPYQRNRYGVYERSHDGSTALEVLKDKTDKRVFDNYLDQISKFCKQIGDDTKNYTATPIKKAVTPAKVDTRKR